MTTEPDPNADVDPASTPTTRSPSTFGAFLDRNATRFRQFARGILRKSPARDDLEPEDLVQQASANFLSKPRAWRGESHFVNLFKLFVRRTHDDAMRHRNAGKRDAPGARAPLSQVQVAAAETAIASRLGRVEQQDRIARALAALEPEQREIVSLRLWRDLSWDEIATAVDAPSGDAVRMKYKRALAAIEREIGHG